MASIDLKDAFYSVPVHKNHQAYLTFFVEGYLNAKWIWTSHVNIYKNFKNTIFYS